MENRKVTDSISEQVCIVRSPHINGFGRLFGGILMQWMDELAGVVTRRHAGLGVTTAAVDNFQFVSGAYVNDMVVLEGKLTYVGNTSMEVRVDAYVENNEGSRNIINHAYFVMVAIDEHGHPMRVPGLEIETEAQKAEWAGGEKRYQLRKERRIEGY